MNFSIAPLLPLAFGLAYAAQAAPPVAQPNRPDKAPRAIRRRTPVPTPPPAPAPAAAAAIKAPPAPPPPAPPISIAPKAAAPKPPSVLDKFSVSYYGVYSGGGITNPFLRESLNTSTGEMNDLQNVDSTLSFGYKPLKDITVGGSYRFIWLPTAGPGQGMDFVNKDPWLSVKHGKLVSYGPFHMSVDLRAYLPVQTHATNYTAFRSTQNAVLEVPTTKLSLGAFAFERINILKNPGPGSTRGSLVYSMFGNYQFHPKVGATMWMDMVQWDIVEGEELSNALSNLSFGVNWDILPNLSVNPSLFILPKTVTFQSTVLQIIVSAKIL